MALRVALRSPGAAPDDMRRTSSMVRVWSSKRRTELASFSAKTESAMRWAAGRDRLILSSCSSAAPVEADAASASEARMRMS
eukprot:6212476-Pleurochrysis_carterae.AAC.3